MSRSAADPPTPAPVRQLAAATAAALAAAVVILFVAVLPAEYGIDPSGAGAALGLLRAPLADQPEPALPAADTLSPVQTGPAARYADAYRTDFIEIELAPYDYVEYKYRLAPSATMVFSWESSTAVIQDFHGAPDAADGAEATIEKGTASRRSGSLVAPFAGMHGWYWENPGAEPVRIKLTTAGFYRQAVEYRSNRTRRVRDLAPAGQSTEPHSKEK